MESWFSAHVLEDVPETQQKSAFTFLIFLIKANEVFKASQDNLWRKVKGPEREGESALT